MHEKSSPAFPTGLLFAAVFLTALFLPRLAADGMFVDGLLYAAVARNFATDASGWWNLPFNGPFYEHPPLQFWAQGMLFHIFGDHWWVERLWCLLVVVLTATLLVVVWRLLYRHDDRRRDGAWLAIVLWFVMPTVIWGAPNNLLDSTVSVFALAAVAGVLQAERGRAAAWLALAGLLTFGGFLTKGLVALFPLAAPFARWAQGQWRASKGLLLLPAVMVAMGVGLLWGHPPAHRFLAQYFDQQVLGSLSGRREMGERGWWGHFFLLKDFAADVALPLVLAGLSVLLARRYAATPAEPQGASKATTFTWFVALSASLPLLISIKQRPFYLLPALPWVALALAAWGYPSLVVLGERFSPRFYHRFRLLLLASALAVGIFSAFRFGKPGRDPAFLELVKTCRGVVPAGAAICLPSEYGNEYALQAYLARYGRWSWTFDASQAQFALVRDCGQGQPCGPEAFQKNLSEKGWQVVATTERGFIVMKKPQ